MASNLISPILSLAVGALEGRQTAQERQRQRQAEEEERRRRQQADSLRMLQVLASLADDPSFQIGGAPGAPGGALEAVAPALGPKVQATPAPPALQPRFGQPEQPAMPVAPRGNMAMPATQRGMAAQLPPMLELASIALGDQEIPVRFDPGARGRARQQEEERETLSQRQAFEQLQALAPDDFRAYVEGFDYRNELDEFLDDLRRGRLDAARVARSSRVSDTAQRQKRLREMAEARALNRLSIGLEPSEVYAELERDPQLAGMLTEDEIANIARDLQKSEASGGRLTEQQARMRVAYARAVPAFRQIVQFLGYDPETDTFAEGGGRVPEESFIGRFTPGRYFQSPEVQAYDQAAEAVASAILRIESGAAITRDEIASYTKQFIPQPGDKPEVIRRKLEAIATTLEAIGVAAGMSDTEGPTTAATAPDVAGQAEPLTEEDVRAYIRSRRQR